MKKLLLLALALIFLFGCTQYLTMSGDDIVTGTNSNNTTGSNDNGGTGSGDSSGGTDDGDSGNGSSGSNGSNSGEIQVTCKNTQDCLSFCSETTENAAACKTYFANEVGVGDMIAFFECVDIGRRNFTQCVDFIKTIAEEDGVTGIVGTFNISTGQNNSNGDNSNGSSDTNDDDSSGSDDSGNIELDFYDLADYDTADFDKDPIEIYFGAVIRLTSNTDSFPVFSPDGSKIAFIRDEPGDLDSIIVVDAVSGQTIRKFADVARRGYKIVWNPNSQEFAFSVSEDNLKDFIYKFDIGSGTITEWSNNLEDFVWDWTDNSIMYTTSIGLKNTSVYVADPSDDDDRRFLGNNEIWEWDMSFNADESRMLIIHGVYYDTDIHFPRGDIYTINEYGGDYQLTDTGLDSMRPAYFDNYNSVAYISYSEAKLYTINFDGTEKQAYGKMTSFDVSNDWKKIVYTPCNDSTVAYGVCVLDLTRIVNTTDYTVPIVDDTNSDTNS